jgi:hypothetical protein
MYDVLIISDFRFPGGTSTAIASEVKALSKAGYRVGLLQVNADILKQARPLNQAIVNLIENGDAALCDCNAVNSLLSIIPTSLRLCPLGPFPRSGQRKKF